MLSIPNTRKGKRDYKKASDLFDEEEIEDGRTCFRAPILPFRAGTVTAIDDCQALGEIGTVRDQTISRMSSIDTLRVLKTPRRPASSFANLDVSKRSRRLLERADASITFQQFNKTMAVELSFLRGQALVHRDRRLIYICEVKNRSGIRVQLQLFTDMLSTGTELLGSKRGLLHDQEIFPLHEIGVEHTRTCLRLLHNAQPRDYYFCNSASLRTFLDALYAARSKFDSIGRRRDVPDIKGTTRISGTVRRLLRELHEPGAIDAPAWQPDNAAEVCTVCERTKFSIFHRRHHCRLCGMLICSECSRFRISVYGGDILMRVCLAHMDSGPEDTDRQTLKLLHNSIRNRGSHQAILDPPTVRRISDLQARYQETCDQDA